MTPRSLSAVPILLVTFFALAACSSTTGGTPTDPTVQVTGVSVSASPNPATLTNTVSVTAVVQPSAAAQSVTWSSSDPTIATVSSSGNVTLLLRGTVTITATSTVAPTRSGSVQLTVVCPAPRLVTDNIRNATTWEDWIPDPGCFDYVVQAELQTNTETLTIEAGTVVGFNAGLGMRMRINAALIAEGTAEKPIVLTGTTPERGWWKGVALEGTDDGRSVLNYVTVEFTGNHGISGTQPAGLILAEDATARVEHSTFQQSLDYGVSLSRDARITGSGGNSFTKNALGAAWAYGTAVPNLNGAVLTGNDVDVVVVSPNTITTAATWPTATYHVLRTGPQSFTVLGGALTLSPGSTLRFEGDQTLLVQNGGLSAVGTPDAPIVFTGTSPVRGHWGGIGFAGSDLDMNRLEYVVVEYGGGRSIAGSGEMANVVVTRAGTNEISRVEIQNSTLRRSGGYGLWVQRDSKLTNFTGNTLTTNTLGAAYVHAPVVNDLLESNEYDGNDTDEVVVETGSGLVVDGASTWRNLGVPFHLQYKNGPITEVTAPLTIEPGVEMLMAAGLGISMRNGGSMTAIGTTDDRITMRAKENGWLGLDFLDTNGSFDYIDITGGGSGKWGLVNEPGTVTIRAASGVATVFFTGQVTLTGSGFGIVFSYGQSIAVGCPGSIYVPPPDEVSDHCHPPGD